jgi:MFS family permease
MILMIAPADFRGYFSGLAKRHGALVIAQTIVAIANTTANAFAMIYLLREGLSYIECSVFLLVGFVTAALFATVGSNIVARDFMRSMKVGMIAMAMYYISLVLLSGYSLIFVPPLFLGIYIVMFWVPYNSIISHITSEKKRGAGVGAYFLVFPAVSTVGPLAGGLMITLGSYDLLLAFGAAVILANLAYLSTSKAFPTRKDEPPASAPGKNGFVFGFSGIDRRVARGILAEGVQEGVFWMALPILSFEYAADEAELGGYLSLFAFWGALMTVALGYLSDRIKDRVRILRISAAFTAASLLVCAFAVNAGSYLTGMSVANFWLAVVPAFLFTMMIDRTESNKTKGMMVREFLLNAGRIGGASLTILLLLFDFDLSISMLVAAAAIATVVAVK